MFATNKRNLIIFLFLTPSHLPCMYPSFMWDNCVSTFDQNKPNQIKHDKRSEWNTIIAHWTLKPFQHLTVAMAIIPASITNMHRPGLNCNRRPMWCIPVPTSQTLQPVWIPMMRINFIVERRTTMVPLMKGFAIRMKSRWMPMFMLVHRPAEVAVAAAVVVLAVVVENVTMVNVVLIMNGNIWPEQNIK